MDTFDPQKYDCPLCGCLYSWSLKKQNEEKIKSNERLSAQRSIYQSRRINLKTQNVRLGLLMGFFVVIIFVGIFVAGIPMEKRNVGRYLRSIKHTQDSSFSLKKIDFPENGYVLYTSENAVAPFTFEANNNKDQIVLLFDTDTKKRILQAFVNAGTTFKTEIPLGVYRMVIIHGGKNWYGFEKKFGPQTQYSEATTLLEFFKKNNMLRGHTVKMEAINGNLHMIPADPIEIL